MVNKINKYLLENLKYLRGEHAKRTLIIGAILLVIAIIGKVLGMSDLLVAFVLLLGGLTLKLFLVLGTAYKHLATQNHNEKL